MSDQVFELYDRKRCRIFTLGAVAARSCPDEAAFRRWLISQGAPADVRIHSRSRDETADAVTFILWSSEWDPLSEGEMIPEWVPEPR